MLQCVVQCVAVCCSVLQCVAVCGAVCCSVLQCIIKKLHNALLMIDAIGALQCVAVCCLFMIDIVQS